MALVPNGLLLQVRALIRSGTVASDAGCRCPFSDRVPYPSSFVAALVVVTDALAVKRVDGSE